MRVILAGAFVVVMAWGTPVSAAQAAARQAPAAQADDSAAYYFLLARHLEGDGKVTEAIAALERAISIEPRSAELQAELAALYFRQDRPREAVDAAERALQRDAANREANRVLGSVFAALADEKKPLRAGDDPSQYGRRAITALERAKRDGSFDVNIELMLGRLYLQTGNASGAVASLRKVQEDQPGYPEAGMLLASAHEAAGQADEAIAAIERTLDENPTFVRGWLRIGQLYDRQHRYKDAAAAYAKVQAMTPRADLSSSQAASLLNAGDAAGARAVLESSMKRSSPPAAVSLYLLAQAQRMQKDLPAATQTADRLRSAFPNDPRGLYLNAKLLDDKGQRREAITAFEALIKQSPDEGSFVQEYASLLEKSGRAADAERVLRDLIARDPLDASALNSLGYMFAERGQQLDEAVTLLQRALKVEPSNPSFLDSLGWAYFKQGRMDLADPALTEAAGKMPASSAIQDHLGDLRFKQQRYADAAAAWERSLASDGAEIDRPAIEKKLRDVRERIKK